MAAIKMKERSLAGSTGIELARALIVDESWNQLNKLTQLMEMIMYLQGESQITKEQFVCKTIAQKDICETRQSQNKTIAICGKRLFYAIVSLRNCPFAPFFFKYELQKLIYNSDKHEPVFSKYCFYGCWCLPYGAEAMGRTAGEPVDEIDATCRAKQLCYKV